MTPEQARSVPWLADLATDAMESDDWSWPRLMSAVPARATGSYGLEAIAAIEERSGLTLWKPQRLVIMRAFEHDDAGNLVHSEVDLSEPRQQGKSVTAGGAGAFRLESSELFGETAGDPAHRPRCRGGGERAASVPVAGGT